MIRTGVAAVLALAAIPAAAQTEGGLIRSGEHGNFSRIVLNVDPETEWSLELSNRRATIVFPNKSLAFGARDLFVRMPRTRILAVDTETGPQSAAVSVQLGCDCRVTTSFVGARYLALDVHDRDSSSGFTFSDAEDADTAARPGVADEQAPVPDRGDGSPATPDTAPPRTAAEALATAEQLLIEQIERAADQGLIELSGPGAIEELRTRPPEVDLVEIAPPAGPTTGAAPAIPEPDSEDGRLLSHLQALLPPDDQIEAKTVFDRDSAELARSDAPEVPAECLADAALDVGRWSDGRTLLDQVGELQRLLVGEFDLPNPEPVRDLARLYIRFGFGTEAEDILEGFPVDLGELPLLTDLARAVESRPVTEAGPLALPVACPGRHGLWLAVAGGEASLGRHPHFRSLQSAFEDMPPDLRTLIGPDLVANFLEAGHAEAARIFFDIAIRPGIEPTADLRLAHGLLAAAEERPAVAEAALDGLRAEHLHNEVDALAALVRVRLDRGQQVPEAWFTDLEAAALQHRGGPREIGLRELIAESRARAGDLPDAFAELVAMRDEIEGADAAVAMLAPRLLAEADPDAVGRSAYAETVLAHTNLVSGVPENDGARIAIGRRLLDLGLANAAIEMLAHPVERRVAEARLLSAQAYASLGAPERSVALLDGLAGPEAARLRARALAAAGDFAAATAVLTDRGQTDAALPYAWASGAWGLVTETGSDPQQIAMAGYMQRRGAGPVEATEPPTDLTPADAFQAPLPRLDEPSLRAARALLANGREIEGFVADLLQPVASD